MAFDSFREKIVIRGMLSDGSSFRREFKATVGVIRVVEPQLETIDLSDLSKARYLKEFQVSSACLRDIDLTPISSCVDLQKITISSNFHLQSIDLSPLSRCRRLRSVCLMNNALGTLDLSPLAECKELQSVVLPCNRLTSIDLTPLRHCSHLLTIELVFNPLKEVDFTPVATLPNLIAAHVDDGVKVIVADDVPRERIQCPSLLSYLSEPGSIARNYLMIFKHRDKIDRYTSKDLAFSLGKA